MVSRNDDAQALFESILHSDGAKNLGICTTSPPTVEVVKLALIDEEKNSWHSVGLLNALGSGNLLHVQYGGEANAIPAPGLAGDRDALKKALCGI
jgi:hypothetical protein